VITSDRCLNQQCFVWEDEFNSHFALTLDLCLLLIFDEWDEITTVAEEITNINVARDQIIIQNIHTGVFQAT